MKSGTRTYFETTNPYVFMHALLGHLLQISLCTLGPKITQTQAIQKPSPNMYTFLVSESNWRKYG